MPAIRIQDDQCRRSLILTSLDNDSKWGECGFPSCNGFPLRRDADFLGKSGPSVVGRLVSFDAAASILFVHGQRKVKYETAGCREEGR